MEAPDPTPRGDDMLAGVLASLGSTQRLAILRQLRLPRTLREIEVSSPRSDAGSRLTRQSVADHVERLVEAGVVLSRDAQRSATRVREYTLNHQAIYAVSEALKSVATLRPVLEPTTTTAPLTVPPTPREEGHRLVLVKGLEEGTTFPLSPGQPIHVVGRRRGVEVCLDFDPYVSAENALLTWEGETLVVEDHPESRNGTVLNFRPLARGERRALRHGDVLGVGRTALVYWT
jgi:DNA-binding transcriptional ArsR family regulator